MAVNLVAFPAHLATHRALRLAAAIAFAMQLGAAHPNQHASAPPLVRQPSTSSLAVWDGDAWREWWTVDRAPAHWSAESPVLEATTTWIATGDGVELSELRLSGEGEAWRVGVMLVRIDPRRLRLRLHVRRPADGWVEPWTIAEAPNDAVVALNAGQFGQAGPWGWLVLNGHERKAPGVGPLAMALVVDSAGTVQFVEADSIAAVRARGRVAFAFQSYPALLTGDGDVPMLLRGAARGIDLRHRDSRLALGELRDGRVLIALTRFEGLGGALSALPLGLTVPEMSALMGALGAKRAMLLDGGISGQLLVRDTAGTSHAWPAYRAVPLALVAAR